MGLVLRQKQSVALRRTSLDVDFGADILEEVRCKHTETEVDGKVLPATICKRRYTVVGLVPGSCCAGLLRLNDVVEAVDGRKAYRGWVVDAKSRTSMQLRVSREVVLNEAPRRDIGPLCTHTPSASIPPIRSM